jgi:hypothetical protein
MEESPGWGAIISDPTSAAEVGFGFSGGMVEVLQRALDASVAPARVLLGHFDD